MTLPMARPCAEREKWLPRFKKLVTYTQDEHVAQNQTQSHPQW